VIDYRKIGTHLAKQPNTIVLASEDIHQIHFPVIFRAINIPVVYVAEYSLKTRLQIVDANTRNPIRRARRYLREYLNKARERRAITQAQGVQCNGTPTYNELARIQSNALLFFDSRVSTDMYPTDADLMKRNVYLHENAPLRLFFSGRLSPMKGADHLVLVAQHLAKLGVPFQMEIAGDGILKGPMMRQIENANLSDRVKFLGNLDFKTELMPHITAGTDIFICCHRQGDPSCTYLETMSCGVPIIGYDNEAFSGLVNFARSGWLVKMNRPDLMAERIRELSHNRQDIIAASSQALSFARQHSFGSTFRNRIAHLEQVCLSYIKKRSH
jgi:glycosyltransferase involved in cell wall biosynthesis